jgi:predicted amidohydrolase YtcJ
MSATTKISALLLTTVILAGCKAGGTSPGADLIITGGPIVTMEGDAPVTAEAVVIDDGKIVFVGSKADAMKKKVSGTAIKDLGGKTLMPGFIDGHAHGQQFGTQAIGANLLAPPDGEVNTIDDVVAKLKTFADGPTSR